MNLSFGQRIDDTVGLVELWLTHGCLDWIKQQDWTSKVVMEFGAGMGDAWLARRCKFVYVVERNDEWLMKAAYNCQINAIDNIQYLHRPCNEGEYSKKDFYLQIPEDVDIIINDDVFRTELCEEAIKFFLKKGEGIFICDNWIQSFVWISPKAEDMMEDFESLVWEQPDHTDNDGINKLKSAVFFISEKTKKPSKPKQNRIEVTSLNVPNEWNMRGDWGSHLPLLYFVLDNLKKGITELGCGLNSTPILTEYAVKNNLPFESYETNAQYLESVSGKLSSNLIANYGEVKNVNPILFVDCAPGEIRRDLIKKYANVCDVIIAHDTQPSAEYVYGMGGILSKFKYRIDYIFESHPMTTAVSNTTNIVEWLKNQS